MELKSANTTAEITKNFVGSSLKVDEDTHIMQSANLCFTNKLASFPLGFLPNIDSRRKYNLLIIYIDNLYFLECIKDKDFSKLLNGGRHDSSKPIYI